MSPPLFLALNRQCALLNFYVSVYVIFQQAYLCIKHDSGKAGVS